MLKRKNKEQEKQVTEILKTPIFADSKNRAEQAAQQKQLQVELVQLKIDNDTVRGLNEKLEEELKDLREKNRITEQDIADIQRGIIEKEENIKDFNK